MKIPVTCESKRLGTKFHLEDKIKFHQQNNVNYYSKSPYETTTEGYIIGETNRRTDERTTNHNKHDK